MSANRWIQHVKDYQTKHGCSYKEALSRAKGSYMTGKGGSKNAGFIRRLVAEKNQSFQLGKVREPSLNLQKLYQKEPAPEPEPEPQIFEEDEQIEFQAVRPKKKYNKTDKREVDVEREDQELARLKRERFLHLKYVKTVIDQIKEYRQDIGTAQTNHYLKTREIRSKRMKEDKRNDMLRKLNDELKQFKDEKENDYPELFQYIKDNKLQRQVVGENLSNVYETAQAEFRRVISAPYR